jgi:hypothetical protein
MRILICRPFRRCGGNPAPEPAGVRTARGSVAPTARPANITDVNGTCLAYRLSGDSGAPVVFVHGSLGDMRS